MNKDEKIIKIPIQDKELIAPKLSDYSFKDHFKSAYKIEENQILYGEYNVNANFSQYNTPKNLVGALMGAYNNHGDILLTPDDVWNQILQGLSFHINKNAEKLRKMFVDHEGRKAIIIGTSADINKINWASALSDFQTQLDANVKGDFVKNVIADFSTTTQFDLRLSQIALMASLQKYFLYIMCGCGIRNVLFTGTLDDWMNLRKKVEYISQYDLKWWTDRLLKVIDQFINTYQGKVDKDFWNKMIDAVDGFGGSGMRTEKSDITGWILSFYPYDKYGYPLEEGEGVKPDRLGNSSFEVPVLYCPTPQKTVHFAVVGGFSGINYENGVYRPQKSFAVVCSKRLYENFLEEKNYDFQEKY